MTPDELTRLRELHEQASPAPWKYEAIQLPDGDYYSSLKDADGGLILDDWAVEQMSEEDSDFVLETRNALPGLLDHIDRQARRLEIAEARLGRVARNHPAVYEEALAGGDQ